MTGGRLHHDIRHSSFPPAPPCPRSSTVTSESLRPPRLFLPLAVTPPFEMSLLLPTAGAEERGDNNNCQRSNVSRVGYGQETKQRERVKKSEDGIARREQLSRREKGHRGKREREAEKRERIARGGWCKLEYARKSGRFALFIEPATNTKQLVSIRPVIVSFTQPLRVAAPARSGRARNEGRILQPTSFAVRVLTLGPYRLRTLFPNRHAVSRPLLGIVRERSASKFDTFYVLLRRQKRLGAYKWLYNYTYSGSHRSTVQRSATSIF